MFKNLGLLDHEMGMFLKETPDVSALSPPQEDVNWDIVVSGTRKDSNWYPYKLLHNLLSNMGENTHVTILGPNPTPWRPHEDVLAILTEDCSTDFPTTTYLDSTFHDYEQTELDVKPITGVNSALTRAVDCKPRLIFKTDALSSEEHQQLMQLPLTHQHPNRLFFMVIGGDNALSEIISYSLEGNVIPIFSFPAHKRCMVEKLIIETKEKGFNELSKFIELCLNKRFTEDPSLFREITQELLKIIAEQWAVYCRMVMDTKNAELLLLPLLENSMPKLKQNKTAYFNLPLKTYDY